MPTETSKHAAISASKKPSLLLISLVAISILIALSVTGYVLTQSPSFTSWSLQTSTRVAANLPIDVNIFTHVFTETLYTSGTDAPPLTYLQSREHETSYCTAFDESSYGEEKERLRDATLFTSITNRAGSFLAPLLIDEISNIMSNNGGFLTALCNRYGEMWVLILSDDLHTMTPYRYSTSENALNAYAPIFSYDGTATISFDHITDVTVIGTQSQEESVLSWNYYAIDRDSGATDLIERCTRKERAHEVTLECSREYIP